MAAYSFSVDAYEGAEHGFAKHESEWDDLRELRRAVYLGAAEHAIDQVLLRVGA